jgi:hypothetical protein
VARRRARSRWPGGAAGVAGERLGGAGAAAHARAARAGGAAERHRLWGAWRRDGGNGDLRGGENRVRRELR